MKGIIRKSGALVLVFCLFLTGCGTSLTALTPKEEDMIAAYASGAVAKANKKQAKGMVYWVESAGEDSEEEPAKPAESETEQVENPVVEAAAEQKDSEVPAGNTTLTEALDLESVKAEYSGYQLMDSYVEGNYFALTANTGNTYLVLDIRLTNTSGQPVECNLLSKNADYRIVINGSPGGEALSTILTNDLTTFIEEMAASQAVDTILIFEVPREMAENISTLSLELTIDKETNVIVLE